MYCFCLSAISENTKGLPRWGLLATQQGKFFLWVYQQQSLCWNKVWIEGDFYFFFTWIWYNWRLKLVDWLSDSHSLNWHINQLTLSEIGKTLIFQYGFIASHGVFLLPSLNLSFVRTFFITVVMNIMSEANWLLDGAESWTHPSRWGFCWTLWEFFIFDIPLHAESVVAFWTSDHQDDEWC